MRGIVLTFVAVIALAAGGCAEAEPAIPPFENSFASPGRLAEAALLALESGDRTALERMRITREEYESVLWEQLPESNDLPLDYVWMLNQRNSERALTQSLENLGGIEFRLMDMSFDGDVEEYDGFTIHQGGHMMVQRMTDGMQGEIPLLDVFVERGGRWKLMNFGD